MLEKTYFSFSRSWNLFYKIDRWLNPYRIKKVVQFNEKPLTVLWTGRAEEKLSQRFEPLYVEMQLFFSCVVKKRVLFYDEKKYVPVPVSEKLAVVFRPVEAASCDPEEFAKNYPEKRELDSIPATKMRASSLMIDFVDGEWLGEFQI